MKTSMRGSVVWMTLIVAACQDGVASMSSSPEESTPQAGGSTSDFGGDTIPCPCAHLQFGRQRPIAVRVTVEAQVGDDRVSLRLKRVIAGATSLAVDDVVSATWDGALPCYAGCSSVSVGDDAFAFYWPEGARCPEHESCVADCTAENEENGEQAWEIRSECSETHVTRGFETGRDCEDECKQSTAEVCADGPKVEESRGRVRLTPWTDPLIFAETDLGEVSVALSDLDELWPTEGDATPAQIAACTKRFRDWSGLLENAP